MFFASEKYLVKTVTFILKIRSLFPKYFIPSLLSKEIDVKKSLEF